MKQHWLLAVALGMWLGCGGRAASKGAESASAGIASYVQTLRTDDPDAAYAMLATDIRAQVSFEEFAIQWRASAAERAEQAASLQAAVSGAARIEERATLAYPDGRTVTAVRERGAWHLESAIVANRYAGQPHDAITIFAEALDKRDYRGVMRILAGRRRTSIDTQIDSFVTSLRKRLESGNHAIEVIGNDRAELRWDDEGRQYKITLRKEDGEWRIDDVHLRPVPVGSERGVEP